LRRNARRSKNNPREVNGMQGNPMDMFDEMDAVFSNLFSRMDREFFTSAIRAARYPVIFRDEGEWQEGEQETAAALPAPVTTEPVTEVHRIGDEVKVIAGLPGITLEELRLDVQGHTLVIDAGYADNHFRTRTALPPISAASMQTTLKNGVLEVTFSCLQDS
jgi:HSP20 family molecular chaperone IbpA